MRTPFASRTLFAAAVGCTLVLTSAPRAQAEPSFPADVDAFIMQPGLVEALYPNSSPPGCRLCHVNGDIGGIPLTAFGRALGIDSTAPSDGQVQAAMGMLQATNPRPFDDLKMGMDPNGDSVAFSNDPTPQYGCGSIATGARPAKANLGAFAALLALGVALLRRRRATQFRAGM
jgi:MYXO-CTERM domain-containing protein